MFPLSFLFVAPPSLPPISRYKDDLLLDDIFFLDCYSTVYVWIGPESNEEEKKLSMQTAVDYVNSAAEFDGRDKDTPILVTYAGFEPKMFTVWFQGWDPALSGKDAYERALEGLEKELAPSLGISSPPTPPPSFPFLPFFLNAKVVLLASPPSNSRQLLEPWTHQSK